MKVDSYEPYIFNPWQRLPASCSSAVGASQPDPLVAEIEEGGVLEIADESTWMQPKKWNRKLAQKGLLGQVLIGPHCDWSDQGVSRESRERLWDIVGHSLYFDWWLLSTRTNNIVQSLPNGWRGGYEHVALGLVVERMEDFEEIENLKKIRTKNRFLAVSASLDAVAELDLTGIHFVITQATKGRSGEQPNKEWLQQLKSHCLAQKTELKLVCA